jgi:hypothetical protein
MLLSEIGWGLNMKKKNKKNHGDSFIKNLFIEIRDSILIELVWYILTIIPRMIFRLFKNLF